MYVCAAKKIDGTEATLMLMTIAYNFLSLFKQMIIGGNVRNRLKNFTS